MSIKDDLSGPVEQSYVEDEASKERGRSGAGRMRVAREQAEKKGCVVVSPKSTELFVDIDSAEALERLHRGMPRLLRVYPHARLTRCTPSPSGKPGRSHVVVSLGTTPKNAHERILLQLLLGSDPVREFLGWERVHKGLVPTLFFEKKGTPEAGQ